MVGIEAYQPVAFEVSVFKSSTFLLDPRQALELIEEIDTAAQQCLVDEGDTPQVLPSPPQAQDVSVH